MVDVEADGAALLVEVEAHVGRDLAGVSARSALELDLERVGLGAIVQLHVGFSSKSRSGKHCALSRHPPR
jgi:hypothetical protein